MRNGRARILFVNHTAGISGPTHSLMMLLPYMRECYDVAVLLPEEGVLAEWLGNEQIPTFIAPHITKWSLGTVARLLVREQFDLVYGNNPGSYSRVSLAAARLTRRHFIWHFRGVKWHWGWRKGAFLHLADQIIAVSHASARSLARFYPIDDIHVVHNGVELPAYTLDHASGEQYIEQRLGIPADASVMIQVSQVKPRKGQEETIEVVNRLVKRGYNLYLLIAGALDRDPAYTDMLRRTIQEHGLQERVHLLGLRTDIPQLLAGSDIFLHGACQDAHPRAVIEAMAAGLPVVAFDVDGVTETVQSGTTGYLVPPDDVSALTEAVRTLVEQPALGIELGQQGRQRILDHFTAAVTAGRIRSIVGDVLGT